MKVRQSLMTLLLVWLATVSASAADRPNVIFVLADDLAQGDVGCYGQTKIKTPVLDRMAREGTRFTQAYSGTSVCAPSRTSLMIGKHMGHSPIRGNREVQPEGQKPLPPDTYTVAKLFKDHGYATACTGKWGMGRFDSPGSPLKVGFDHFFGYNCQRHAHEYFPTYLYRDDQRFSLDGKTYSDDLLIEDTVSWIKKQKDQPFFLFHSTNLPHGKYEIDSLGEYENKDWTPVQKTYAAMVTRLDSDLGRILSTLKEIGADDNTLVIFAGDNGSSFPPNSEIGRLFNQAQGLRGYKRSLYEGGLRQACIARWPGQVPAGRVCDEPWAFWDFLPTCADLIDADLPAGVTTDGLSILPLLKGGHAPDRDYFYWELHESGPSLQAVRFEDWKAVKNGPSAAVELYDLKSDPGEKHNQAADHPQLVAKAETLMKEAHTDSPDWPLHDRAKPKANAKRKAKAKTSQVEPILTPFDRNIGRLTVVSTTLVAPLYLPANPQAAKDSKDEARRHVEKAGGFSFIPPEKWTTRNFAGLKFQVVIAPPQPGFTPNIAVVDEAFEGALDEYVEANIKSLNRALKDVKILKKEGFQTASGLKGGRLIVEDEQNGSRLRQVFYFFDHDKTKYVLTCSNLAKDGDSLDPVFEQTMKTFRFDQP